MREPLKKIFSPNLEALVHLAYADLFLGSSYYFFRLGRLWELNDGPNFIRILMAVPFGLFVIAHVLYWNRRIFPPEKVTNRRLFIISAAVASVGLVLWLMSI
jgi:hypothetical protein